MNIYLISQTVNSVYDTYDSAVVCAATAEEARHMRPSETMTSEDVMYDWASPEFVTVKLVGTAAEGVSGVICASYNAG